MTFARGLLYLHEDDVYGVSLGIKIKRKWMFTLHGWLPEEFIAVQPKPSFVVILADKLHTNEEWKKKGMHLDKKDSDLYFSGEVIILPNQIKLIQQYFRII